MPLPADVSNGRPAKRALTGEEKQHSVPRSVDSLRAPSSSSAAGGSDGPKGKADREPLWRGEIWRGGKLQVVAEARALGDVGTPVWALTAGRLDLEGRVPVDRRVTAVVDVLSF
jgi:hypothetical protein